MARRGEPVHVSLTFYGSITDLATDVAAMLTPAEAVIMISELDRFRTTEQSKFKGELGAMMRAGEIADKISEGTR